MKKVMLLLSLFCFVGSISAGRSHSPILQELVHKQLERQFEKRQSDQRLMAQQQIALENAENEQYNEQSDEAPTVTGILCSDCIAILVPHNPEEFATLTYDEKIDILSRIKAAHDAQMRH